MSSDIKVNGIKFSDDDRLAAREKDGVGAGIGEGWWGEGRFRLKRTVLFIDLNWRGTPPQVFLALG